MIYADFLFLIFWYIFLGRSSSLLSPGESRMEYNYVYRAYVCVNLQTALVRIFTTTSVECIRGTYNTTDLGKWIIQTRSYTRQNHRENLLLFSLFCFSLIFLFFFALHTTNVHLLSTSFLQLLSWEGLIPARIRSCCYKSRWERGLYWMLYANESQRRREETREMRYELLLYYIGFVLLLLAPPFFSSCSILISIYIAVNDMHIYFNLILILISLPRKVTLKCHLYISVKLSLGINSNRYVLQKNWNFNILISLKSINFSFW